MMMSKSVAIDIFRHIENDRWTDKDRLTAIGIVLGWKYRDQITKAELIKVIEWLYEKETKQHGDD